MPEIKAREAKLIQYLNEAYGTEKRLETALIAHITMAERAPYKKRLRQHLTETKRHGRDVSKRIRALGGKAEEVDVPGPERLTGAAELVVGAAQRAAALAQGPMHALRGTGIAEKQLKNAKTEYASEAEEIATYSAIETLAEAVGDRETARLAKAIRREEERMSAFLAKEIGRLTAAVAREEIPASERRSARSSSRRNGSTASRSRSSSRRTTSSTRSSSNGSRSTSRATGSSSRSAKTSRAAGTTRKASGSRTGSRSRSTARSR